MTERLTSCFFSSILSETASLAAVARVVALASVWPFAISAVGGVSVGEETEVVGRQLEGDR